MIQKDLGSGVTVRTQPPGGDMINPSPSPEGRGTEVGLSGYETYRNIGYLDDLIAVNCLSQQLDALPPQLDHRLPASFRQRPPANIFVRKILNIP